MLLLILVLLYFASLIFKIKSIRLRNILGSIFQNSLFAFIISTYIIDKEAMFSLNLLMFILLIYLLLYWITFFIEIFVSPSSLETIENIFGNNLNFQQKINDYKVFYLVLFVVIIGVSFFLFFK